MKLSFLRRRPSAADLAPVPVPVSAAPKPTPPTRAEFTLPPTPAAPRPAPRFQPGRYVVEYDRLGKHATPQPLTVWAMSAADLAAHIRADVEPYVGTDRAEITVDMLVSGGKVTAGDLTGTFLFTHGGRR